VGGEWGWGCRESGRGVGAPRWGKREEAERGDGEGGVLPMEREFSCDPRHSWGGGRGAGGVGEGRERERTVLNTSSRTSLYT
jgi:hypothetical protein